jgi:hypothetical protein
MPRQIPLIDYQARRVESESVTRGKSAKEYAGKNAKEGAKENVKKKS